MRALNSQKMTNEALSVASDVLKKLGVEALWLTQKNEVHKFREKIRKLVNKQTCKRLAALSQISDERKLKVSQTIMLLHCFYLEMMRPHDHKLIPFTNVIRLSKSSTGYSSQPLELTCMSWSLVVYFKSPSNMVSVRNQSMAS